MDSRPIWSLLLALLIGPSIVIRAQDERCSLSKDVGPCQGLMHRYYYNSARNRCEFFFYGGCKGNDNNFESLDECHEVCSSSSSRDVHIKSGHCRLEATKNEDGNRCKGYFRAFTFNAESLRCERFVYGGCGATQNLYFSLENCLSACTHGELVANRRGDHEAANLASKEGDAVVVRARSAFGGRIVNSSGRDSDIVFPGFPDPNDICKLPPMKPGNLACLAFVPKWTYNFIKGECEQYVYGGCRGTANLFDTKEECSSTCSPYQFRGSSNNAMVRQTGIEGERPQLCYDPPLKGNNGMSCLAYVPKFTYNADEGKCEEYGYGGCFGSDNLFDTLAECRSVCKPNEEDDETSNENEDDDDDEDEEEEEEDNSSEESESSNDGAMARQAFIEDERPELCNEPPLKGNRGIACLAYIPKFTFNATKGVCEDYVYGGCFGSDNLFDTLAECRSVCNPNENDDETTNEDNQDNLSNIGTNEVATRSTDVCSQEMDAGRCFGLFTRYGFNARTQRCEAFIYGGCGGNGNRFETASDCLSTCGGSSEPESNPLCSEVKCDLRSADLHLAKGCTPITKSGHCCPSSWDCSNWENRLKRLDQCFLADNNNPNGQYFDVGDEDLTNHLTNFNEESSCLKNCKCVRDSDEEAAHIECENKECSVFEQASNRNRNRFDCRPIYDSLGTCCPSDEICPSLEEDLSDEITCKDPQSSSKVYYEGEKLVSQEDPCKECICTSTGELECQREHCFQQKSQLMLIQGCTPVYKENVCCPVSWLCPRRDSINERISDSTEDIVVLNEAPCPQGSKLIGSSLSRPLPKIEPLSTSLAETNSEEQEKSSDVCLLPRFEGICAPAHIKKVYFDSNERRCKSFLFGGGNIKGNHNVFENYRECLKTCRKYIKRYGNNDNNDENTENNEDNNTSNNERDDRCSQNKESSGNNEGNKIICAAIAVRRFVYNEESNECVARFLDTCGLRKSFSTLETCEKVCKNGNEGENTGDSSTTVMIEGKEPFCQLPPRIGSCRSRVRRYYYDSSSGLCKLFHYSGCQGNANNFEDLSSCIDTCVPREKWPRALESSNAAIDDDVCSLAKRSGNCRAFRPSFYFDKMNNVCKFFVYGGCNGNNNRFDSLRQCAQTCPVDWDNQKNFRENQCKTPSNIDEDVDSCENSEEVVGNVFFYDNEQKQCRSAKRCLGRRGHISRDDEDYELEVGFRGKVDCVYQCILAAKQENSEEGSDEDIRKHIFRDEREIPLPFVVANDPLVVERKQLAQEDPCLQPKKIGFCRASIQRYYFDNQLAECKMFRYGGCAGNSNNFASMSDCQSRCRRHLRPNFKSMIGLRTLATPAIARTRTSGSKSNPICALPLDSGLCLAYMPRYYFDVSANRCKRFVYGGCGGNENNFDSLDECLDQCGPRDANGLRSIDENLDSVRSLINDDNEEKCKSGNDTFALGDVVRFNEDACQVCRCEAPPSLSCVQKTCEPFVDEDSMNDDENCKPIFDEDNCCQIGVQCPKICDKSKCPVFSEVEGANCVTEMDEDECCIVSMACVPDHAPSVDPAELD